MKWSRAFTLVLIAGPLLFLAGFIPGTATASQVTPAFEAAPMAPPDAAPQVDLVGVEEMEQVSDVTKRITPYLYIDGDGLVQLADVSATEVGVTEQFLSDFREALRYSNELIERGEIVVSADMSVEPTDELRASFEPINPGYDPGVVELDALGGSAASISDAELYTNALELGPGEGRLDWSAWHYGSGAMFYNTYPDWTYYRYQYYPLCNAMAAWIGYPWMGQPLIYFYCYNQVYFGYYCYSPYGLYFFMPYGYCQMPLGYKPAYFWARVYYPGFGYQWGWRGIWCRY